LLTPRWRFRRRHDDRDEHDEHDEHDPWLRRAGNPEIFQKQISPGNDENLMLGTRLRNALPFNFGHVPVTNTETTFE